jgi:hypothetical protein
MLACLFACAVVNMVDFKGVSALMIGEHMHTYIYMNNINSRLSCILPISHLTYLSICTSAASLGDIDHCEVLMRAGTEIDLK